MKKLLITLLTIIISMPVFAFEDCLVMTNGKLNNIKIQHNDIIDVFPLITVMNDKNTLIVHPFKVGETKFSVTKNNNGDCIFTVKVTEGFTTVTTNKNGFEILNLDCPPGSYMYYFDLDQPPAMDDIDEFVKNLDEPPFLKGDI